MRLFDMHWTWLLTFAFNGAAIVISLIALADSLFGCI